MRFADEQIPPFLSHTKYLQQTPGRETEMLKLMKVLALVLFAAALALPMWMPSSVEGQGRN